MELSTKSGEKTAGEGGAKWKKQLIVDNNVEKRGKIHKKNLKKWSKVVDSGKKI